MADRRNGHNVVVALPSGGSTSPMISPVRRRRPSSKARSPEAAGLGVPVSALASRAARATEVARRRRVVSRRLVEESRTLRGPGSDLGWPRFFVVRGTIEEHPALAYWWRGALSGSSELIDRAQLLVAMGEQFVTSQPKMAVTADLHRPLPALLSALRACDQIQAVRFNPISGTVDSLQGLEIQLFPVSLKLYRVRLVGELDLEAAPHVKAWLLLIQGGSVEIDLTGLEFIDAAGVRALIEAHDRLTERGHRLVLRGARGAVRKVLHIVGLEHWLID